MRTNITIYKGGESMTINRDNLEHYKGIGWNDKPPQKRTPVKKKKTAKK